MVSSLSPIKPPFESNPQIATVIEEVPAYLRDIKGTTPSIIVLVGLPGAGKTTYYMHYLQPLGYKLISQLTDRDIDNCVNTASVRLEQGEIVRDPDNDTFQCS